MARHKIRKRPPTNIDSTATKVVQKAAKILELPVDFISGMVHFEFSGNREVVIEGCRGVLEYDENIICIDMGKMKARFMGRGLELRNFTDHSAVIDGFISSVEFLT